MTCTCGKPSDGWPDNMCQDCWEAYCDKTWWEEARLIDVMDIPHGDDHDPAWHGNLASIRNADIPRGEGTRTND